MNNADSAVYQIEKSLRDFGDKVSTDEKQRIEAEIENVKKIKDSGDPASVKEAVDKLNQVAYDIFGKLYQQQAQAGQQPPTGDQGPQGGNGGVETDYEVHDDNK